MPSAERKAIFRRLYERLFNENDLAAADELATPDFVDHGAPPNNPHGPEGLRNTVMWLQTAFPDMHYTINDLLEDGDRLAMWVTVTGTHLGNFLGTPPTGRTFTQNQMHLLRLEGDRVAEHWAVRDDLGLMQQLGLLPQREPSATRV